MNECFKYFESIGYITFVITIISLCSASLHSQTISITKNADLQFGAIIQPASAGTVTISTSGSRSASAGIILLPSSYGSFGAASYNVVANQARGHTITITIPSSITISNGGSTMTVNTFTKNPTGPRYPNVNYYTFTLYVGARLNITANQPTGSYTGTFNVTVNII